MQLRTAQKSKSKIRIGLAGPSGSGKTYSALLLASGLTSWSKICVIDTERQSADLYSDLGPYNVITLDEFSPQKYEEAIHIAEDAGMEVIIVDSITHEWKYCLQLQEKLGGRWQDWAKVTPIHDRFIEALLKCKAHLITSVRSKSDYMMTQEGGKSTVQKVGLKPEQREGFEYELAISFDLNISHLVTASKDRTGLFMDADPFMITKETGKKVLEWSESGEDPVVMAREIEKLMPIKGVSLKDTLTHYKVEDLADLDYPHLIAIKDRLNELKDKESEKKKPDMPEAPTKKEAQGDSNTQKKSKVNKGQIKLLEMLIKRRAKKAKKGYKAMLKFYLKKADAEKLTDLDAGQVRFLTDFITSQATAPKKNDGS